MARKFDSTTLEPREISERELFLITRMSWETEDLLESVLAAARDDPLSASKGRTVAASVASVLTGALVLPQLDLDATVKNALGLMFLSAPFFIILLTLYFPKVAMQINSSRGDRSDCGQARLRERVATHEAGHLLAGYLCGIPILSYDASLRGGPEQDAGLEIELSMDALGSGPGNVKAEADPVAAKAGHLLVVAMAGVVAELLRFGDSRGGFSDIPVALRVVRLLEGTGRNVVAGRSAARNKAYLRWALLKAIILLRLHREALDEVTQGMLEGRDVMALLEQVENADEDER